MKCPTCSQSIQVIDGRLAAHGPVGHHGHGPACEGSGYSLRNFTTADLIRSRRSDPNTSIRDELTRRGVL